MSADDPAEPARGPVVLFDGVCGLCHGAVNFIAARDPHGWFRFASLQSAAGQRLLRAHGLEPGRTDSLVCITGGRAQLKSAALIAIARELGGGGRPGGWRMALLAGAAPLVGSVIPRFMRDWAYDRVAANRYRWFGRREACRVPDGELTGRFLDGG